MKKSKIPSLVTVIILTIITLVFWLFFSIYQVFTKTPQLNVAPQIIEPLDPLLDKNALDKLQGTTYFEESQIPQTVLATPTPEAIISPSVTPTPTASPSASPTPTASPPASPTP